MRNDTNVAKLVIRKNIPPKPVLKLSEWRGKESMLKIVVFDSGYGGEMFADRLARELPVVEIIRVIDWRHANQIQSSPTEARKIARAALRPYIGRVDLIILANHLLTVTSLKYFRRKYKQQKFIGLNLKVPNSPQERDTLVLTTRPVKKTVNYYNFLFHSKRKIRTVTLDSWPSKIDDGVLEPAEVNSTLSLFVSKINFQPKEVVLACAHFNDLKPALRSTFGHNLKIYDSFDDTIRQACKTLHIRGGTGKKMKK